MRLQFYPALLALAITCSARPLGAAESPARKPPVQLSSPYERMLHEQIANGRVLPRALIERFGLDLVDEGSTAAAPTEANRARPFGNAQANAISLGPDHQANDRTGDVSCTTGCAGRPLSQSETTVAAWGGYVVAGWNDSKGFCAGAVQGWATSARSEERRVGKECA